jgi:hypothetical protein
MAAPPDAPRMQQLATVLINSFCSFIFLVSHIVVVGTNLSDLPPRAK